MNILLPRLIKSAYRREPISSFILLLGSVDAVLGGVSRHWTLLSFGLSVVFLSALLRWWKTQQATVIASEEPPRRYLPASSSRTPLPLLVHEKNRR